MQRFIEMFNTNCPKYFNRTCNFTKEVDLLKKNKKL